MESGQANGGGLFVASGDASPLLEPVDAALDGVALLVGFVVEVRWSAAVAAPMQPVASGISGVEECGPGASREGEALGCVVALHPEVAAAFSAAFDGERRSSAKGRPVSLFRLLVNALIPVVGGTRRR